MACTSQLLSLATCICLGLVLCANAQPNEIFRQDEIHASPSIPQITFVATTKQAALEAQPVANRKQGLEDIVRNSRTFAAALSNPDEPGDLEGDVIRPQGTIVQSSKGAVDDLSIAAPSGLLSTIVEAYNHHHELVLRPDDVWQAVLTQLSFYVQANAEELRDRFVDFRGKKELTVTAGGSLFSANFASMAARMVDEEIVNNIKDASIAEWLLPNFSTTTSNDRVVASVSVMATLQAYFEYKFSLLCGIPRVTLLGGPADWRKLRAKVDRLPEFDLQGREMSKWTKLLGPVLDNFVLSAEGKPDLAFWDRVASHEGGGSGPSFLSGWVTVFAVFTDKGKWQGDIVATELAEGLDSTKDRDDRSELWPMIDTDDIPLATLAVPVLVDDNGVEYATQMLAGQFAFDVVGDGKTVQPRSDWCIVLPEQANDIHTEN